MEHIVFDSLSFNRKGFGSQSDAQATIGVGVSIDKINDGQYRVILQVSVDQENEYEANAQISGFCLIDENLLIKQEVLEKNVVAILFPYIRAQLTLLTAQPGTTPIVLPAMNIDAMINQASQNTVE